MNNQDNSFYFKIEDKEISISEQEIIASLKARGQYIGDLEGHEMFLERARKDVLEIGRLQGIIKDMEILIEELKSKS